ncbi:patatin-like phospholipase [Thraustotheca clavata]|uniref:Patatin-like phospholipase n=1 Tax=Thraustotheca clavata TaxID=74557 RepID=A0A1W0A8E2_9STRA|nr:patatin-like phospholipase [Thraustotheca clavata]
MARGQSQTLLKRYALNYMRFWLYISGLQTQATLWRNLLIDWKFRASTKDGMLVLARNFVYLLWRSIRLLMVPDVFFRYFVATFSLQLLFEAWQLVKQQLLTLWLQCSVKGRRILKLRRKLANAKSLSERQAIGAELDTIEGLDKWRKDPTAGLFHYERVQKKIAMYRRMQAENDVMGIMFSLRAGLLRKHWGLGSPSLYGVSYVGTKHIVDEYMDTILESMDLVLRSKGSGGPLGSMDDVSKQALSIDNKLAFFSETRHAFGRSALMLSGGGGLGLYHSGIIKTLIDEDMLPQVISGASAGSIVAGCVGVRTDEELPELFATGSMNLRFFGTNVTQDDLIQYSPSWLSALKDLLPTSTYQNIQETYVVAARFFDKGHILDNAILKECLQTNMGDFTFREAYDRTGRIINITVTPSQSTDYPQLLNYLTAPNVLVWSASLASCAIPLIFAPVELLGKDQHGNIVPVYREGLKWSDGSVECDLPMERLSELFNVNHFIVSQVNIHYKFISGYASLGGGDILGFLKKQMKAYIKNIAEFGLNTSVLKFFGIGLVPLLTQTYEGDVTIPLASQVSFYEMCKRVLVNPSQSEFDQLVLCGERATWPHLSRIQTMCRIEYALERSVRYLRGEQAIEDEKRTGISSIGRVPSFYTSASSMNLSGLTKKSSAGRIEDKKPMEKPIKRNKSINVAGAFQKKRMSDDESSELKVFCAKYNLDINDDDDDVEELDLSEKELTEVPREMFEIEAICDSLKTLCLERNQLTTLPEDIGALKGMTELYLRQNQITVLPKCIAQLQELDSLYLEDNLLNAEGIPDEFGTLMQLKGLCLHRNQFVGVPKALFKMTALEELYLDNNLVEELPEEIGQLINLRELDMIGNRLRRLPKSFVQLAKLEILHLEGNVLEELPKGLGGLVSLKKVYLQDNAITKLHSSLGRCGKMEVINIENNKLTKVAKRIGELPRLKHLLLAGNKLESLPFNPYEKAPGLRRLTLSGNNLAPEVLKLEHQVPVISIAEGDEDA